VSIHPIQVKWHSKRLNRHFWRLSQWRPGFWRGWFSVGAVVGVLTMLASTAFLSYTLHDAVQPFTAKAVQSRPSNSSGKRPPLVTPVLPGVNLPASQLGLYFLALLACGILHELGHAVAACCSDVRVNGFGFFLALVYPGAFVDLSTDSLQSTTHLNRLRIFTAGVWHNVVIAVLALLMLNDAIYRPFYATGEGAVVADVMQGSVISGHRGLSPGDVITKVGNCEVKSSSDWLRCLNDSNENGYCVPSGYISQYNAEPPVQIHVNTSHLNYVECCSRNHTAKDLCFRYLGGKESRVSYACLPARSVSERPLCRMRADCSNTRRSDSRTACVFPSVANRTKLLRLLRKSGSTVLFLGNPVELKYTVKVTDFQRRFWLLPVTGPEVLGLFLKYLASFSGPLHC